MNPDSDSATLVRRQAVTVALLVAGYAGYYLCRSNFSVALPLVIDELAASGMTADEAKVRLGTVMARVAIAFGWRGAFEVLASVAFLSTLAALGLLATQRRARSPECVRSR